MDEELMRRRVRLTVKARQQLHKAADWYRDKDSSVGAAWLDGFERRIESLSENPERCGLARESDQFPHELRELYYGSGRKNTHRALFHILEDEVVVVGIRHFAQDEITPNDV